MAELGVFDSGAAYISEEVIGVIASIAASEVKGVAELQGSFSEELFEFFRMKNIGKGVNVVIAEQGIDIDIDIVVDFGTEIQAVALQVQRAVRDAVESMTATDVHAVNVNVQAINFKVKK